MRTAFVVISIACSFVAAPVARAAPRVAWAIGWGTPGASAGFGNTEHIRAVDSDAQGNVLATGPAGGDGPIRVYDARGVLTTLPGAGKTDVVIAKVRPSGELVWAKAFGGPGDDGAFDLSLDRSGAIFLSGRVSEAAPFGELTVARGAFLAKLDANGVPLWSVPAFGIPNEQDVDASGNVFTVSPSGVAKHDGSGATLWRQPLEAGSAPGLLGQASVRGVAVADDGTADVLVAGQFATSVSLGGATAQGLGGLDAFVARLRGGDGTAVWLRVIGSDGEDYGRGVSAIGSDVFVAGAFSGSADLFGEATLRSAGARDVFVARLDGAGHVRWATSVGGPGQDEGAEISTDRGGGVVIGGSYTQGFAFGATTLPDAAGADFLIATLDGDGRPRWAVTPLGGPGADNVFACGADALGGWELAGGFEQTARFGDLALTSSGGIDGVFGRIVDDVASPPDAGPSEDAAAVDAGTASPTPKRSGGGCSVGSSHPSAAWVGLLAVVALARAISARRRRSAL
jgi:hypothetical protein